VRADTGRGGVGVRAGKTKSNKRNKIINTGKVSRQRKNRTNKPLDREAKNNNN